MPPARRSGDKRNARIIAQRRFAFPVTYEPSFELQVKAEKLAVEMKKLTGKNSFIHEANKKALLEVQKLAAENLEASVKANARPDRFRSGRLKGAILANRSHEVTKTGFKFMVRDKVEPKVPYYHALEVGNDYWVGKFVWLSFLGASADPAGRNTESHMGKQYRFAQRPDIRRGNTPPGTKKFPGGIRGKSVKKTATTGGALKSDRLIGPGERKAKVTLQPYNKETGAGRRNIKVYRVKIRRPVPAYRYGTRAKDTFLENDMQTYSKILDDLKKSWVQKWETQLATQSDPVKKLATTKTGKKTKKIPKPTGKNTKLGDPAP